MTRPTNPLSLRPLSLAVASALALGSVAAVSLGLPSAAKAGDTTESKDPTPVCEPGLEKAAQSDDVLAMYEVGDGTMITAPALPDAATSCMKLTAAGYTVNLDGQSMTVVVPQGGGSIASYLGSDRSLTADTTAPVLCESYYSGTAGYTLRVTNSNTDMLGGANGLLGVSSISYTPSSGVIMPVLMQATNGPWISCVSRNSASAGAEVTGLFGDSFESGADIRVSYLDGNGVPLAGDQVFATINNGNATASYQVKISNLGADSVSGLRLREFIPKTKGSLSPAVTAGSCVALAGGPACQTDGDGAMVLDVGALASGQSLTYDLTRTVVGATAGAEAVTFIAAFVDPDVDFDSNPDNNARRLRIVPQDNAIPSVDAKSTRTNEDTPIGVTFTGTDSDGTIMGWNISSQPAHGSVGGSGTSRTYTPAADFNGTDSFTYTATDDKGAVSSPATVTITIDPVNDGARVSGVADKTCAEGSSCLYNLWSYLSDPEGDSFTGSVSGLPAGLTYTFDYQQGVFLISGTPTYAAAALSPYTVTVSATDSHGATGAPGNFTLTITNTNRLPVLDSPIGAQSGDEGGTVSLDVSSHFSDPDPDDVLTFAVTGGSLPPGLSLATNGLISGSISQTAAPGSPYSITVTADDGQGGTASDTFDWTVNAVNVVPNLINGAVNPIDKYCTVGQNCEILSQVAASFEDQDGDSMTFEAVSGQFPSGVTMFSNGAIGGQPSGAVDTTVTVKAKDQNNGYSTDTLTINFFVSS